MTPAEIAALLIAARRGGPPLVPAGPGPDLAACYAVQDRVAQALGGIAGWKGGPADPAAIRCSPIVAGSLAHSPARYDGRDFRMIGVEAELAFVLGSGFARGETPSDAAVLDAVASAHVAIEVCDTRLASWEDADAQWKLADFQGNRGLVLGDAIADWRGRDLARQPASIAADGQELGARIGPSAAGDPRAVLGAMVRHLCGARTGVAAGAAMTTGSWTGLAFVAAGARVVAHLPGLGQAEARF